MKKIAITMSLFFTFAAVCLVGCPAPDNANTDGDNPSADESEHHGHTHGVGPHGGTIADWGGGAFHVEFTVDHDQKEATIFVLGDDQKSPVPVKAEEIQLRIKDPEMQVALKAVPLEGEAAGSASRFVGNHESLGVIMEYAGTISGVVDGTPYTGDFKEESHDHSDH